MRASTIGRTTAAGALALAFLAGTVTAASAATEPATYPASSDAPIYLIDGIGVSIAAGTQLDWTSEAFASAIPSAAEPADWEPLRLPYLGSAARFVGFISAPGDERTKSLWKAFNTAFDLGGQGPLQPSIQLSAMTNGAAAAVKSGGGTYSLGIAYLNAADTQVLAAAYTTINVDAGIGTWKFATPVAAQPDSAPVVTTHPTDKTVAPGATATFTAAASGQPTPTVQWQSSTNGTDWSDIAGATSTSYVTTGSEATGTQFHAVFTNPKGSATTNAATLTVSENAFGQNLQATVVPTVNLGGLSLQAPSVSPTTLTDSGEKNAAEEAILRGTLSDFSVKDERDQSSEGWTLNVALGGDFAKSDDSAKTIPAANFGLKPVLGVVDATLGGNPTVVTTVFDPTASENNPTVASKAASWQGSLNRYGTAHFTADLSLVVPRGTPAGQYGQTLTVTLVSGVE